MVSDGAWREWWGVVLHPFRYVAYVRLRRVIVAEVERAAVSKRYTYVGPVTDGRVDVRHLPVM